MYKHTEEYLVNSLKNLSIKLDRNPTSNDLGKKNNMPNRSVFELKFSSWNSALSTAGLRINNRFRKWTKEDIIKWLKYKYEELAKRMRELGKRDLSAKCYQFVKNVFDEEQKVLSVD